MPKQLLHLSPSELENFEPGQIINPFSLPEEAVCHIFYDPRTDQAILLPDQDSFYKQLVSRNYPFLSAEQQNQIRRARIGIVGQGTVGGNLSIAMSRYGFEHFRICDHDYFDLSNLNRQPSDLFSIGINKAEAVANQIQRINPFAEVEVYAPLTNENLSAFVADCDVVVSALDDVRLIVMLNHEAMQQQKPLLLGTDLGSRVVLDVMDYRKTSELLNGRASLEDLEMPYLPLAMKIIGAKNMPLEMLEAILMRYDGKINYFAQTIVSANLCSSMLLEAAAFLVLDKPLEALTAIDIIDNISPQAYQDERNTERQLLLERMEAILEGFKA